MKRVLSTGDIASSPIGDSIDNGGPFTQQKGRRKKPRKANPVAISHSITDDTDALRSTQLTQSTQSTQCITAPASPEFSLLQNKIDELLCTVRSQQEIIKVLSEKLNFVLSFLDAPGGLGGMRCAAEGSTDTVNSPKPSTSSLVESQGVPDQPRRAQPTSYSGAVGVQAGQTRRQPPSFREIVAEAISAEQRASERRAKSVIVTGLAESVDSNDKLSFKRLHERAWYRAADNVYSTTWWQLQQRATTVGRVAV